MKNSGRLLDNQTWQTECKTASLAIVQLCEYENQTLESFVPGSHLCAKFDFQWPTILDKSLGMISISPSPHSMLVCFHIPDTYSKVMPSQSPTLNEGGRGIIFDSRYWFLAVSLKKCLSGDNYRRPSQLLLTRIVAATELYLLYMIVKLPYGPKSYLLYRARLFKAGY